MLLDCGATLSRPVTFDLCLTNTSVTVSYGQRHWWTIYKFVRVYSSKTLMSNACFHNFDLNRMIYTAISTEDLPSALANLGDEDSVPSILRLFIQILIHPQRRFCNPLRFLQNQDFFLTHRNSIPYTRGILMCLLGFRPSGPKPCGGNKQPSDFWFHQVLRCFRVVWSQFWTSSNFVSALKTTTNNQEVKRGFIGCKMWTIYLKIIFACAWVADLSPSSSTFVLLNFKDTSIRIYKCQWP